MSGSKRMVVAQGTSPGVLFLPFSDPIRYSDEPSDDGEAPGRAPAPWVVLVADDDRNVHDATVLALAGERVQRREIELLHAYDAVHARQVLAGRPDIAAVLLDIVMETPDAGLKLIDAIRSGLGRPGLKIIVRTGQPGLAPEAEIRGSLAIDGYLTKAQLTRALLLETLERVLGASEDPRGDAPQ